MARSAVNVDDYRRAARQRLPRAVFDVVDGAADDELSMSANRRALDAITLRPRALADVRGRDLRTTVLGEPVSMPVMLAPCGIARMMNKHGELGVARAAGRADVLFAVSTVTSYPLEAVAAAATGPLWFQLYPPADPDACRALIERAAQAGYRALCVTIDGAVLGRRQRDARNGLQIPVRLTPRLVLQGARRPRWALDYLRSGAAATREATMQSPRSLREASAAVQATANPITVETMRQIREAWDGPLVVKGVMRAEDVEPMVELGVQGIVVSNHGGRQLDGVAGTTDVLPGIVAAAAGRLEVYVDGGYRRGTDVLKALALGARAVLIGRPYLFALAAGGEQRVVEMLQLLRDELDTAMALTGCTAIDDIGPDLVTSERLRVQEPVLPSLGAIHNHNYDHEGRAP
jgi:isopentenyl diphosphate isomerase/L-lactate dehydrogenase-like FMN-dependent dehydrogenase